MAPISTKVISLLTTMLDHVQHNPDDSQETEMLIKATLQAISGTRRSSIRRMGDAFLDFADERPGLALCVIITMLAVPQQIITEVWREIYPTKVRIEVKDPQTGVYIPADNQTLHALFHVPTQLGEIYAQGLEIEFQEADIAAGREITTRSGHLVRLGAAADGSAGSSAGRFRRPMPRAAERSPKHASNDRRQGLSGGYSAERTERTF